VAPVQIESEITIRFIGWKFVKSKKEGKLTIDGKLLEILACPKCKGDLEMTEENDGLVCNACKLKYPIRDDIPVMLVDEAEKL